MLGRVLSCDVTGKVLLSLVIRSLRTLSRLRRGGGDPSEDDQMRLRRDPPEVAACVAELLSGESCVQSFRSALCGDVTALLGADGDVFSVFMLYIS